MSRLLPALLFSLFVGAAAGLGGFTFFYAKGYSYLTNDPAACANCHIMGDYYAGWQKASHHAFAACNDCHTPEGFFGKYLSKLSNGFWHSFAFTSGDFPDPLRIKPHNLDITEARCLGCHGEMTQHISRDAEPRFCIRCHDSVGHMR